MEDGLVVRFVADDDTAIKIDESSKGYEDEDGPNKMRDAQHGEERACIVGEELPQWQQANPSAARMAAAAITRPRYSTCAMRCSRRQRRPIRHSSDASPPQERTRGERQGGATRWWRPLDRRAAR